MFSGFLKSITAALRISVRPSGRLTVTGMPSRSRKYFSSLICIRDAVETCAVNFFCTSSSWFGVSHGFSRKSACRKYRVSSTSP